MFINIKINKKGLKSEPKNFEDENGQFVVKLAKLSENGEWEYASEEKCIMHNVNVPLELPEEWKNLFDVGMGHNRYSRLGEQPFWMAVKVEMVDNKLV